MSLNFNYFGKSDTKKWTKADWEMYERLVWALFANDIGNLNEVSVDEFLRREQSRKYLDPTPKKEELVKFFGLCTNVTTLTSKQWAARRFSDPKADSAWKERVLSHGCKK